ncbi:MAG: UvrD-helicase domain-containing protein [Planctomycetaceae bacterium]|nr:UvrD-helicase domain-containing protein [Planctomycetaceae bacterium]MBT6483799.1 UvrD-helicase domain-containing protein [Planctomycetaceae bacterium]MBT6496356.1 UvrD-helicase domain-containing protein [Planctomycetaceae bacterium]
MDRHSELNPPQRDAVTTLSGPLLVLAGAGTGKTRVITARTAELIRSGIAADRILCVTFTNKAAREMQGRIAAQLGGGRRAQKPWVSTFHSLCVRILRQEITALGYPLTFSICDRRDQESIARTALRDIRVGDKTMRPGDLVNRISRWKSAGVTPDTATAHTENDLDFLSAVAFRKYQIALKTSAAVDFDDLLLLTNQLFCEFPDVLSRQQQRFDHVLVDEYQDTNTSQFQIIESLVREHDNLCVVGDDDQSIYGWRGAEVEHILGFQSHFPGAKVVRLEDNYRCTAEILDLANRLVRHNRGRHDKKLIPHKTSGEAVRFAEFPDEVSEAENVVREIKYLVNELEVSIGDIAILFRTNEQPRLFETELRRSKLNYILMGGQSFFDRREIRDMLAYLKAIAQPKDEVSLLRIINTPARGIGNSTVEKLLERSVRQRAGMWDVIPVAIAQKEISAKAGAALGKFQQLLNRYREQFQRAPHDMARIAHQLMDEIDYEGEIQKQYKDPQQQIMRSEMLDQFIESINEYVKRSDHPSLAGYLEDAALEGRDEESDQEKELEQNALKLMTLHSAKGLEFPRVYMVGMEENLLPHRRSIDGDDSQIAEERRLAYVGITRAKDHLTLCRAASRKKFGKSRPSLPSRFLFEMRSDSESAIAT